MPVQTIRAREKIPFDFAPDLVGTLTDLRFGLITTIEVFPREQESLGQERGLDEIGAIIVATKGNNGPCGSIKLVRKGAVKTLGFIGEKLNDLEDALGSIFPADKTAFNSYTQVEKPHARRTDSATIGGTLAAFKG